MTAPVEIAFPTRYREAEERSRRLGRGLKRFGRVHEIDESLYERFGRAFLERDEPGAALAAALRAPSDDPNRVSMGDLQRALHTGPTAEDPPALAAFLADVVPEPEWLDWDLVNEGARVVSRMGRNAADVLLQLSLIGGYRFGGPTDLLVATGGLTGDMTRRRLAETQQWTAGLTDVDALRPPASGRPAGDAWRMTVHVRAMHALVNHSFEPHWDVARFGLPINQADQAVTLGLFDGVVIIGCRGLGVPVSSRDSRALMHLFRYVGHLLGVHEDFLVEDEWARHRLNYHALQVQMGVTDAGPALAQAVVDAQRERRYPGWPDRLQGVRARWERERLLSMLTLFLGRESMRDLGLPPRPPWAHLWLMPTNFVKYHLLGHTRWGRGVLERQGRRWRARILSSYFVGEHEDVGELRA